MARPGSGGGGREHRKFYTVLYFLQNKTRHFSNANLVQDNLAFLLLFHLYPHTPTPCPAGLIGVIISLVKVTWQWWGAPHLPNPPSPLPPTPHPPIRLVPGAPWRAFTSNRALKAAPCHKCQTVTVDSGDLFEKLCFWSWIKGLHFSWRPAVGWLQCQEDTLRSVLLCSFKPALILWLRSSQQVSHRGLLAHW